MAHAAAGMKTCPFCAEAIKAEAIKCRYCGSAIPVERAAVAVAERGLRAEQLQSDRSPHYATGVAHPVDPGERTRRKRRWILIGVLVVTASVIASAVDKKKDDEPSRTTSASTPSGKTAVPVASASPAPVRSTPSHGLPIDEEPFIREVGALSEGGTLLSRGRIELKEYGTNGVRMVYHFHEATPAHSRTESEVITTGLVTFAIKVLIHHGYNPREQSLFLSAHAYQPASPSVTGARQVRTYGKALYDYNDDKVIYKAR